MKMLRRGLSPEKWIATCQILLMLNLFTTANGWFALTNVLELILWCIVLFVGRVRKAIFSISDVRLLFLLAFVGWVAVAMFWGQAPFAERLDELLSWRKIVLFPIALAVFKTTDSKLMILKTFCFWVSIYATVSWVLFLSPSYPPDDAAYLLENDVVQAIFFSFAALSIVVLRVTRELPKRPIIWGIMFVILISNVFIVGTGRSGYLFFIIGFSVLAWCLAQGYRLLVIIGLTLSIVLGFSILERPLNRVAEGVNEILTYQSTTSEFTSMGIRMVMWKNTIEMIKSSPMFGTGSGSFYLTYADLVRDQQGWRAVPSDDPHNQYLHLWAEQGFPGLCLFLLFLLVCATTVPSGPFGLLALVLILGISATSMFSGHFSTFVEGRLFWIVLGVCLSGSTLSIRSFLVNRRFNPFP